MKNIFLMVVCVYVSCAAFAQYNPVLLESNTWKGVTYGWGVYDFYQSVQGDSLIGGQHYMKVYTGQDEEQMNQMVGLLRENTEEKRIYIWTGTEEHLIYDFDVEAGDVVSSWGVGMEQNITVVDVETITIAGTSRRKINFNDQWGSAYWIEGMGSVYGLMDGVLGNIVDYSPIITCFFNSNDLVWDNPIDNTVCDSVLSVNEFSTDTPMFYPNPFHDVIQIAWNTDQTLNVECVRIYSSTGSLISETQISSSFTTISGLQHLASGLYTLSMLQDGKPVVSGRIYKQ